MPLVPAKDRTISLTLESDLERDATNTSASAFRKPSQSFVDKFIPTSGITGAVARNVMPGSQKTLELVGPTSISWGYEADVAVESGLFTSFLQPWFIKPVQISLKGESYLGTFPIISRGDKDVERILDKFIKSLNDFSSRVGQPGTGERILLEVKNNPRNARSFLGYMRRFNFEENVNSPYFFSYDLNFIGFSLQGNDISTGRQNGRAALARSGGKI